MRRKLLRRDERSLLARARDDWTAKPKHKGQNRLSALGLVESRSFKDKEIVPGLLWLLRYEWRLTDAGRAALASQPDSSR